jgi:hypothetical protein
MSVRWRLTDAKVMEEPQVSLRALVVGGIALVAGLAAGQYPEVGDPSTASLATFIILDRLTS